MIKRVIRFSAENRWLVIAATIAALAGALWTMKNIPLDALPDLSDTQVIVYARWDRSPDILEDQVTYPIATALLGAHPGPRVPVQDHPAAAPGSGDRARSRRHQRGLGLPVRPGRQDGQAHHRRAAELPGLVPALRH